MINFYEEMSLIKDEIIENRRTIHKNPETGFDLDKTSAFVKSKLKAYGIEYDEIIKNGIVCTLGQGDKCLLIRSDMDALFMNEENDEEFKSANQNAHMCGHDMHTAMALAAAYVLKKYEKDLKSKVKIMFQPAEEIFAGSKKMIDAGVLQNPEVDAAVMIHVDTTKNLGLYIKSGVMTCANNNFKITVHGKGCHGAMPHLGIDASMIGSKIVGGLQTIVTREIPFQEGAVLTCGHFDAGTAPNIIPETALIEGTMRTYSEETQKYMKNRIREFASLLAQAYRGTAETEYLSDVPAIYNDEKLTAKIKNTAVKVAENNFQIFDGVSFTASDDFAFIADKVPSVMLCLGVKTDDETIYPLHNPKAKFNENALIIGASVLAAFATEFD